MYFVDIRDTKQNLTQIKEKYYHGWIVLQCDVGFNGEYKFSAQRLLGNFLNKQEFEKYQKNRKIFYGSDDDYDLYEMGDFEMDDFFEDDDEYELYENEYVEELAETYKDYAGDILDEYIEYAQDCDEYEYYDENIL